DGFRATFRCPQSHDGTSGVINRWNRQSDRRDALLQRSTFLRRTTGPTAAVPPRPVSAINTDYPPIPCPDPVLNLIWDALTPKKPSPSQPTLARLTHSSSAPDQPTASL